MTEILRFHWLLLLLAAPCVGSFLGLLVARLPLGKPVAAGRSACPACGHALGPLELIPVLGWLLARGRCRHCGGRVSWAYPAVELGALFVALWSLAVLPGWLAWAGAGLGWCLLALAAIDARHLILPNVITLPLIPAGLAVAWALGPARLLDHALGAATGFLVILLLGWAYRRLRGREGIGLGDAKLFAAVGAWVSWEGLPSVLLLAAAAALVGHLLIGRLLGAPQARGERGAPLRERELPCGPYIAGALWLIRLYGPLVAG